MSGFLSISNKRFSLFLLAFAFGFYQAQAQTYKPYFNQALKLFYFSKDGKLDTSNQFYDYAEPIKEGIALVRYQHQWQFLDSNLQVFCDVFFSEATGFTNGFATVYLDNGQCHVVNKQRQFLFSDPVDQVSNMQNGYLAFSKGGKWGLVNDSGQIVLAPTFDRISDVYGNTYWAKQSGRWALWSINGQQKLPETFELVSANSNGNVIAFKQNSVYLIETSSGRIKTQYTLPVAYQAQVCKALYLIGDLMVIQLGGNDFIALNKGKQIWQKQASQFKTDGYSQLAFQEKGFYKLYDLNLNALSDQTYEDLEFYPEHWLKIYLGPYYYFKTPEDNLLR